MAVINTVRSESLTIHAKNVGTFLREGIKSLAADHPNIGTKEITPYAVLKKLKLV